MKVKSISNCRDGNIELLRIICICGVVILHYNGYVGNALDFVAKESLNYYLLYFLEGLFVCAVNLFILISGYYSINSQSRKPNKIFNLLFEVVFFNIVFYILNLSSGNTFTIKGFVYKFLPINYFVIIYSTLFIISPYINILLKSLSYKSLKNFVLINLILFSIIPTIVDFMEKIMSREFSGLYTMGTNGSGYGYTFINFLLMYIIGASINILNINTDRFKSLGLYFLMVIILAFTADGTKYQSLMWSYCNPIVILEAVFLFLAFKSIKLKNKLVNEFSKATFTCFLVHPYFLNKFRINDAVQMNILGLLLHISICVISIYMVSYLAYKIYSKISKSVINLFICNFENKLKLDFSVDESK